MSGVELFYIFLAVLFVVVFVMTKSRLSKESTTETINKNERIITSDNSVLPVISSTIEINGMQIHLTEEEIKKINQKENEKAIRQFNKEKKELLDDIKRDIENCDDIIKKKVFEELLKQPLESQTDYNRLQYIYNNGKLRSNEEVEQYDKYTNTEKQRENFNKERHVNNGLHFFVPFVVVFLLTLIACDFDPVFGIPLGFIFGGIAAYIGMMMGYNSNIKKAKEYCIPDNDPRVIDEKRKRAVGIASGIAAGTSIGKHAKKNTKELLNPDSWGKK